MHTFLVFALFVGPFLVAPAAAAPLGTAKLQKAAVACEKTVAKATAKLVTARFAALDACANAALSCVQTKLGQEGCFSKAAATCNKKLSAVASAAETVEGKIASAKSCAVDLRPEDLLSPDGLGLGNLTQSCQTEFGLDICGGLEPLAACLVRTHERAASQLYGQARPRTGELLGLLQEPSLLPIDGLPTFPGCGECSVDVEQRKPIEQCGRTITKATQKLVSTLAARFGSCVQKVFACVQAKSDDDACLPKATTGCDQDALKIDAAFAKYEATITGKCGPVGFDRLVGTSGLNLAAVSSTCPSAPTSVAEVAGCVQQQARCAIAALTRSAYPRVLEFDGEGRLGVLGPELIADCFPTLTTSAPAVSGARGASNSISTYVRGIRRTNGNVNGSIASGGKPSTTVGASRSVRTRGQPSRVTGKVSTLPFTYRRGVGRAGDAQGLTPPRLVVSLQRDDFPFADHFEVPLNPEPANGDEVSDEIEITYETLPGCAFTIGLAIRDDVEVSSYEPVLQVEDQNLPTPIPTPGTSVVISDAVTTLTGLNDCDLDPPNPPGSTFQTVFNYTATGAPVSRPTTQVAVGFAFPTGTSNSFFATGPVTGNGQGGTVTFFHCYRFSSASFVDVAFLITDTVGLPSNVLAIQIAKPSGGNAPLPGP